MAIVEIWVMNVLTMPLHLAHLGSSLTTNVATGWIHHNFDSLTRSSRPTTCKEPKVAQLPRAYIWKNQNDDCFVPCVGSHLSGRCAWVSNLIRSCLKPSSCPNQGFFLTMLRTGRTTTRLTGFESPGWRLFTDGGFKRNIDGTELTCWVVAAVSPELCSNSWRTCHV